MARATYATFKATKEPKLAPASRWLADRPDVVAEVETQLGAGEPLQQVYEWLMSDDAGDVPLFKPNTLRTLYRDPDQWARIRRAAGLDG